MNLMKTMTAATAVAFGMGLAGAAQAAPVFQLDFTSVGGAGLVTADSIQVRQNADLVLNIPGLSFTENGLFRVTNYQLGGNPVITDNLGTGYNLYATFTSSGTLTQITPTFFVATFTSLNFTLFLDPDANTNLSGQTPAGTTGDDFAIASGSLLEGTGTANLNPAFLAVTSNTNTTFNTIVNTFFTSPVPFYNLQQIASNQTAGQLSIVGSTITIQDGGATVTFASVPEPATLAMFGAGLLGLAAVLRRRREQV